MYIFLQQVLQSFKKIEGIKQRKKRLMVTRNSRVIVRGKGGCGAVGECKGINADGRGVDLLW